MQLGFFFFKESALLMQFEQKRRRETKRTRRGKGRKGKLYIVLDGSIALSDVRFPHLPMGFAPRELNTLHCPVRMMLQSPPGAAQRAGAPGTFWGCGLGWLWFSLCTAAAFDFGDDFFLFHPPVLEPDGDLSFRKVGGCRDLPPFVSGDEFAAGVLLLQLLQLPLAVRDSLLAAPAKGAAVGGQRSGGVWERWG